MHALMRH